MKIRLIISLLLLSIIFTKGTYKLTSDHHRSIRQAKALQKNGLIEEAMTAYYDILNKYPYLSEAFKPLKSLLKKQNKSKELYDIAEKYLAAHNSDNKAKIEVLDIYIWLKDIKWETILNDILNSKATNDIQIKKVLDIMLKNNLESEAIKIVKENIRLNKPAFFSLELAMYYSLIMSIEKSIDEFFLHLEYNPNKKDFIFNRILALPDINFVNDKIITYLYSSDNINSKILLSKIEFKQKNFQKSYELLRQYSLEEVHILDYIEDLMKIKEYNLAQIAINDLLSSSVNKDIVEKAIYLLAQTFEDLLASNNTNLFLINHIMRNQILDSPFIKINQDHSMLLNKAITIYDSLRIHTNKIKPQYHLAEIKYKILGDLDGAAEIYKNVSTYNLSEYSINATGRLIDIMICNGNLEQSLELIKNYTNYDNKELIKLLSIKEIQILYYQSNKNILLEKIEKLFNHSTKSDIYYNDILQIMNTILLFNDDAIFERYTKVMLKLFQNKRTEAINLLEPLLNNENKEISGKIKFEYAYLNFLQGNIEQTFSTLNTISIDSIYKEFALILEAEIYDYILDNKSKCVDLYLFLLDNYPENIYYDLIRMRLRKLAS